MQIEVFDLPLILKHRDRATDTVITNMKTDAAVPHHDLLQSYSPSSKQKCDVNFIHLHPYPFSA